MYGVSSYTLKVLVDALRIRGFPLRGSRIALLGFTFDSAHPGATDIRSLLTSRGAHVMMVAASEGRRKLDDKTIESLRNANAVVIAMEHPVFRAVRPKEFKAIGIGIVIPATTRT